MAASKHRPVLIVIAEPNGSSKTSVTSKILHHGELAKRYVDELPDWASTIFPKRKATN